jgi:hypothetical protein
VTFAAGRRASARTVLLLLLPRACPTGLSCVLVLADRDEPIVIRNSFGRWPFLIVTCTRDAYGRISMLLARFWEGGRGDGELRGWVSFCRSPGGGAFTNRRA